MIIKLRFAHCLGKGVLLRSQSKCIIMNVHTSVSKDNPKDTLIIISEVANVCGTPAHSLRKLLKGSNKLNFLKLNKLGIMSVKKLKMYIKHST